MIGKTQGVWHGTISSSGSGSKLVVCVEHLGMMVDRDIVDVLCFDAQGSALLLKVSGCEFVL